LPIELAWLLLYNGDTMAHVSYIDFIDSGIHFIHAGSLGLNALFTALGNGIVSGSTWSGTKAAGDSIGMLIATAFLDMTSNPMSVRRPSYVAPYQKILKGQDYASTFSGAEIISHHSLLFSKCRLGLLMLSAL
jgi:hypothetical protein